ncbi:hypothetical protein [Rhizobium esperanzae]|uniref:Uncharacterized protein n=1 Tax=Rhizobium esperanzae TaxID=1967781 RepID=A0A7W6R9N1_9HYPH|nr:hypothetical protein [Rhizobium esperanzae]MBB4239259.1 hypothetical protein [Rhizobium esperanzae]
MERSEAARSTGRGMDAEAFGDAFEFEMSALIEAMPGVSAYRGDG